MRKIELESLELKNFKGEKERKITFGVKTNISADNGVGKSTVSDAFHWILFDKDALDRKNFDIKPFDKDGEVIHGLESSVVAVLKIDGNELKLKKIYKEKWTKKRGLAEKIFSGNETTYEIDDIPVKKKDYEEKIKEILDEKIFKLVTNPFYFPRLNWKEQREVVQAIIGGIDDEKVINYNSKLEPLRGAYKDTVENHMIRTQVTIKKLKEQLKQIPFRIDELNNSLETVNVQELEDEKQEIQGEINKLDEVLEDSSKGNEILMQHKQHLFDLKNENQEKLNRAKLLLYKPLEHLKEELSNKRYEVQNLSFDIKDIEKNIEKNENCIKQLVKNIEENEVECNNLREKFKTIQKQEFKLDANSTICPMCRRELENSEEIIQELEEKFNLDRANKLKTLNNNGKKMICENKETENNIDEVKAELFDLEKVLKEKKNKKLELDKKIATLDEKIENFVPGEIDFDGKVQLENEIKMTLDDIESFKVKDNSEIKTKKRELLVDLEEVNKKLATKDNNKKIKARIEELEEEEKEIGISVAKQEEILFLCEEFIKTKVELSEGLINKKFKSIKFKLFNEQINGGISETCEILCDGVPYSNANSASQINAGIEVINTLSEFYEVNAPVWIDNAESVNKLTKTNSQLIRLVVSKDKELKVEIENE